jgi:hypothetical protein
MRIAAVSTPRRFRHFKGSTLVNSPIERRLPRQTTLVLGAGGYLVTRAFACTLHRSRSGRDGAALQPGPD